MSVIPSKFSERVTFFQNRIDLWTSNSAAIGLTAPEITALGTKADAAAAAMNAADVAHANARSATLAAHNAVLAMTVAGSELVKKIKTKAATDGDNVYTLANIPAPATPSPKPAPGTPTNFTVTLGALGELKLKWKCPNPPGSTGTIYQIWRRLGAAGETKYLAGTGKKEFTDATVPAGTSEIVYQIQASRSTKNGLWATFTVLLGSGAAGAMTASVTETPGPKMAA